MTEDNTPSEALAIVERAGRLHIEVRRILREQDKTFLVFERSDGTDTHVEVDGARLLATENGRVEVDFVYQGSAVATPQQDVRALRACCRILSHDE